MNQSLFQAGKGSEKRSKARVHSRGLEQGFRGQGKSNLAGCSGPSETPFKVPNAITDQSWVGTPFARLSAWGLRARD